MLKHFDLWSYHDVRENQDAILDKIRRGRMPSDGAWPLERVIVLESWIAAGPAP